ncbi:TRAP transporter small permease [Chromohalobacter sp. HP20-39]|uniref:TRAP transporter small permease subunit n=1 Tax=Chromohalobacter sp. HP20-39 TaxID=3079306 RepID=UPI00294B94F9|nr:TRAP transporter small permease [Chromohalobacter sp. HP20-39]MDV6317560.1 TRAP transporter small permease [Chromohalobacter sp. HP20-39]
MSSQSSSSTPPETPEGEQETSVPVRSAFDRGVVWCARRVAWLVFIAMAISVYEVIMRYGFNSPTSWVHESVVMLVGVTFALSGPAALASNKHIRVRVLYDSAGPRLKLWLDRFNDLVTFVFCLGMSYAAFTMFWTATHNPMGEWDLERSGTSWNPPFPAYVKTIIMVALIVMCVQSLIHLYQSLRGKPATPSDDQGAA